MKTNWQTDLRHGAWQFRWQLALIGGLSFLVSVATLAIPWLAAQFLGQVVASDGEAQGDVSIVGSLALLVVVLIAITGLNIAAAIATSYGSGQILAQLRSKVHTHVQLLPLAFHDHSHDGDVLALLSLETGMLADFFAETVANLPSTLLTAAGAALILFWLDPAMALIVPVLIPVFFVLMKLLGRRMRVIASGVRAAEAAVLAHAESDLSMLPAIKASGSEGTQQRLYQDKVERARQLALSETRILAFIGPSVALIAALSAISILVLGGGTLNDPARGPADLFAFLLYAALLTRPVGRLASVYGELQLARGAQERLTNVLSHPIEAGYADGLSKDRASGAIAFSDVTFAYPGREPILRGFNLYIKPGEVLALTGSNGVGKSTLVRLLLRFYEVESGAITLDGHPICDWQVQSLRRQFGYVPQRALLFNGTIAQNITFGEDAVDADALDRAVRLSQAVEFISKLEEGLDTEIGDNGVRLSGGQRQRITLARALYRDPPIYILDEATSMYDLESEAAFVEDCMGALKDRTVIVITHRPASLELADRILEISPVETKTRRAD